MSSAKALILSGYGINCEHESRYAFEKSGGVADIVHINRIIENPKMLEEYNLLVFPGGFSFGDDLGSGKVFANKLKYRLHDPIKDFVNSNKLVIGICNGFQMLVKLGILPSADFRQKVTLAANDSGKFEDRWVFLKINQASPCLFTTGMDYLLLPVRHGEGKFIAPDDVMKEIEEKNLIAMQYVDRYGKPADYPYNPNGSMQNIAGICDETGGIFGLMPHPEAFNIPQNCPYWPFGGVKDASGLKIFKNAVKYLTEKF